MQIRVVCLSSSIVLHLKPHVLMLAEVNHLQARSPCIQLPILDRVGASAVPSHKFQKIPSSSAMSASASTGAAQQSVLDKLMGMALAFLGIPVSEGRLLGRSPTRRKLLYPDSFVGRPAARQAAREGSLWRRVRNSKDSSQ